MPVIPAAPWLPDAPEYQNPGTSNVSGVLPDVVGYRPFPAFTVQSSALSGRARGLWYGRSINGNARIFCGDATKLYTLSGTTWNDVTGASGPYACPRFWSFAQFGDLLLAFNGVDDPQVFTLSDVVDGSVKFADLAGTPPVAEFITVVRDFAFAGKLDGALSTNQWSAIDNAESWATSATTMADQQIIPSGGNIRAQAGGEYGVVLQDDAIQRYTFVGGGVGNPIFQRDVIATAVGCSIQGSFAQLGNLCFFYHRTGFQMLVNGTQLVPIGKDKVDRTFAETLNQNFLDRVSSAIDHKSDCYLISFPDGTSASGTPNVLWAYHRLAEKWSPIPLGDHEMIATGITGLGVGIDDADGFADDIDAVGAPPLDSEIYYGAGLPLLAAFDTSHKLTFSNGANLAATVDTTEQQPIPGQKSFIRAARPIVDSEASPDITLSIGTRNNTGDAPTFSTDNSPTDGDGLCKFRVKGRYVRGRIKIAAGETWTHIQGVDEIVGVPVGNR